jgi:hypothetical protein
MTDQCHFGFLRAPTSSVVYPVTTDGSIPAGPIEQGVGGSASGESPYCMQKNL